MQWIHGTLLNEHVGVLVANGDRESLAQLADVLYALGVRLQDLGVAHGDIQHGNVLVDRGELRLVDYDDMFLPNLRHLKFSSGIGHENYQHPKRASKDFDERIDRFSLISIYVTLRALAADPQLWNEYEGGEDCLLFRKADFLAPYRSPLFQRLDTITEIKELVDRFASVCASPYEAIPSLRDFVDGEFEYGRYIPITRQATRPFARLSIAQDAPAAVSPIVYAPLPTPNTSGRMAMFVGLLSLFVVVVLTSFAIYGRDHSAAVASSNTHVRLDSTSIKRRAAAPRLTDHAPRHLATRASAVFRLSATPSATVASSAPKATATPSYRLQVAAAPKKVLAPKASPNAAGETPLPTVVPTEGCSTPDAPARLVTLAQSQLSDDKRAASAGKSVVVTVDLAADGTATDATVKNSSDDVTLDFAALAVARRSVYSAAREGCKAERSSLDVTVTY